MPLSPPEPWGDGIHYFSAPSDAPEQWTDDPARIWVVSRYQSPNTFGVCDLETSMAGRARTVRLDIGDILVERYDR